MVLHEGKIAEMKTGEARPWLPPLPVYLNALAGKGVHVVTVNDYLPAATRPQDGQALNFLGLTTGVVYPGMPQPKRTGLRLRHHLRHQQRFGFDYLRDNMVYRWRGPRFQRGQLRHRRRSGLDPDRRGRTR